MRIYLANKARQLPVEKQVQWHGVLVCENFPEGIMIYEYARIQILTVQDLVQWKSPIVGPQIWSQMEKLVFLEIWDVPWRISMATSRRGTINYGVHGEPSGSRLDSSTNPRPNGNHDLNPECNPIALTILTLPLNPV